MSVSKLVKIAKDKDNFLTLEKYVQFCLKYLAFVEKGVQATIVSQNENHYRFWQYKADGHFNITRPINGNLMFTADEASVLEDDFLPLLKHAKDLKKADAEARRTIIRSIYTVQQTIGAALDALPAGDSNRARKINGDLFERFIQLLLKRIGLDCGGGTVQVPVVMDGQELFKMSYQHDLLVKVNGDLRIIGSVKTSSKDRIDKIFLDKFLYSKLTGTALPHIAVFLNDVQRKNASKVNEYGINATFLPGHFKGFTVKLNPLDGVYYCDIRPNMVSDALLNQHIKTIDHLFCSDIWGLISN